MAEQSPVPGTPPAEALVAEGVMHFNEVAGAAVGDFNAQHEWTGGVRTPDGAVTTDSLNAARAALVERAKEDPALAGMLEAVAAPQAEDESGQARRGRILAFLKVSGGTVPSAKRPEGPVSTEYAKPKPIDSQRARQIGHPVLADGHVVRGYMVSGRKEILTGGGVLRTRGTPHASVS